MGSEKQRHSKGEREKVLGGKRTERNRMNVSWKLDAVALHTACFTASTFRRCFRRPGHASGPECEQRPEPDVHDREHMELDPSSGDDSLLTVIHAHPCPSIMPL